MSREHSAPRHSYAKDQTRERLDPFQPIDWNARYSAITENPDISRYTEEKAHKAHVLATTPLQEAESNFRAHRFYAYDMLISCSLCRNILPGNGLCVARVGVGRVGVMSCGFEMRIAGYLSL